MDKVGVAVIGTGLLGERHARVFAEIPETELVAVADIQEERAKAVAEKLGVAWYTDTNEMLKRADVQAVSVATPDHLHREPVLACLNAGKHVLTEKPLSTSLADALAMLEAARGTGLVFMVNFSQRLVPENAWIKRTIDSGLIGTPLMAQSLKQDQVSVPTDMIKSWSSETSPVFFMTSHAMDLIHWFFGSEPVEVMAYSTSKVLTKAGYKTPDGIQATVKHANGETALYHSSWIHPATFPVIAETRLEVLGDQGVLSLYARTRRVELYSNSVNQVITFEGPHTATEMGGELVGAFRSSLELFWHSIVTGEEPMTSAANTLTVTALEFAVHDSLAEGKPVNVTHYLDQLRRASGG